MRLSTSAISVTAATAISRVLGLVREQMIATLFGAGFSTDAYNTAFRIPNLLRDLFAEGALGAAFVPVLSDRLKKAGQSEAFRVANLVINTLLLVVGAATVLILLFSRELTWMLASGFFQIPGKAELAVRMARILSSFLMFVSLAAAAMGILNVYGRFFLPALAPAIFNLVNIILTVALAPVARRLGLDPILALAVGSMIGGIAQFAVQVPALYKQGYRYAPRIDFRDPSVRRIASMLVPAIVGLSVTQFNVVIDTQIASHFGNGPVTWLNYAFRLIQLPIGLFGVSLATVNLVAISKMIAGGEAGEAARSIRSSVETSFLLNGASSAGLIVLAVPIIRIIFQHGRFTAGDTAETATVLVLYSIGIAAYSGVKILAPAFYALGRPYFPLKASAIAIGIKIALNLVLFREIGFNTIALTTSLAAWINFTLLTVRVSRLLPTFGPAQLLTSILRSILLSAGMGCVVWLAYGWLHPTSFLTALASLGAVMAVGVVFLGVAGTLVKSPEVARIARVLKRSR